MITFDFYLNVTKMYVQLFSFLVIWANWDGKGKAPFRQGDQQFIKVVLGCKPDLLF